MGELISGYWDELWFEWCNNFNKMWIQNSFEYNAFIIYVMVWSKTNHHSGLVWGFNLQYIKKDKLRMGEEEDLGYECNYMYNNTM